MKNRLKTIFSEILREVERNPEFRERIDRLIECETGRTAKREPGKRRGNRRTPALIDPYVEFACGEEQLRQKLQTVTVEQLKDIVSEHALDSSRLALKWKNAERLIDLIITTVRSRVQKGDAFRN
jgi:hypothetical protein